MPVGISQIRAISLIALSLAFALVHAGPLHGTGAALVITILTQLILPGWLLARAFGKHRTPHPIARFTWVLAAGMGLVVCLGAVMRLLQLPVSVYLLALHSLMAILALLPSDPAVSGQPWRFDRRSIPLYALLAACCAAVVVVGSVRQIRFNNFADQTVFVSYADWLATRPEIPAIHTRMAGTIIANRDDVRLLTDGWTYNHAAWVWTSGVPAAQLLWYDLTPLFVWTIPLVIFALAYELSGRETAAAWSAAALTIAGLMTLDALVYRQNNLAFGQFGLLQLNTLRMFSRALMLPLALFAGLMYLGAPRLHDLALVFLAGMAVAVMHPQQVVIFLVSMGATTALWWLAQTTRFRWALALALIMAAILILPYFQRSSTIQATRFTTRITDSVQTEVEDPLYNTPWYILVLEDLPIVGTTYIMPPSLIFYHPIVVIAAILGLIALVGWRRSLAAQYIGGATAITLSLLFVPGLTAFAARITVLNALPGLVFGLPIALVFGIGLDTLVGRILNGVQAARGGLAVQPNITSYIQNGLVLLGIASIILLLFEPFPIPASAHDQIRASNQLQSLRDMHVTDQRLLDSLLAHLPADGMSVLLTPNPVANYIMESVPGAIVTGGRRGHDNMWAFDPTLRFFGERPPLYGYTHNPWLDTFDLNFMAEFGVTHIIVEADDVRLPQLLFQPERFQLLDTPAGYLVFQLDLTIAADETDARFEQMNATYGDEGDQRWNVGVFELYRPANPEPWADFAETWAAGLAQNPGDDRARYGLAVTYTLMGRDEEALVLWEQLGEGYPQAPALIEAEAFTLQALGRDAEAVQTFAAALDSPTPAVRVLAANHLLTPPFFTHLEQEQIEQIIAVAQAEPEVWEQLVVGPALNQQRQRANLLMSAGMLDTALDWLAEVPEAEISPQDLTAQASIFLAQGDVEGALSTLRPALDPDDMAAARFLHPDRWENNTAAPMYSVLAGEVAFEAVHECPSSVEPVSPLAIAETRALYVMDVFAEQNEQANALTVCATFGSPTPPFGYDVRTWRVQIVSPDAETRYGAVEVPAMFGDGMLTRTAIAVPLSENVPRLTPAQVYVEAMHDNALVLGRVVQNVVLNRPNAAVPDPDAVPADLRFGDTITLRSYAATQDVDRLQVTLYWEASAPPTEDYQMFIHVLDIDGHIVAQRDTAPVDNRYPTSQWRAETLIEDRHVIALDEPLPPGEYHAVVGLYRLSDGARLPVTPAEDERVANDSVLVYTFSR
jgi:Flp pilus assembly protein TadD